MLRLGKLTTNDFIDHNRACRMYKSNDTPKLLASYRTPTMHDSSTYLEMIIGFILYVVEELKISFGVFHSVAHIIWLLTSRLLMHNRDTSRLLLFPQKETIIQSHPHVEARSTYEWSPVSSSTPFNFARVLSSA